MKAFQTSEKIEHRSEKMVMIKRFELRPYHVLTMIIVTSLLVSNYYNFYHRILYYALGNAPGTCTKAPQNTAPDQDTHCLQIQKQNDKFSNLV